MLTELGTLIDPSRRNESLDVRGCDRDIATELLRMMLLIRRTEEVIGDLAQSGRARCPCHLGIGQEAIPAGLSTYLRKTDRVFGAHRSHGHYLALGGSVEALLAEVLGRATGCSKGMGGSMHLYGAGHGFYGSVPIVAGTVPLAVGAALAAKMDGAGDIGVAYFGDGAVEEGSVHESMNLASRYSLPVLFVCENNLYSSHLDIRLRQPSDRVARFADAHCMRVAVVDGNDVLSVANAARELVGQMRQGEGPAFIEAVTYRWRGHVGPDENVDVGVRRSASDLTAWKQRDPVRRMADGLIGAGLLSDVQFGAMRQEIDRQLEQALTAAFEAPQPNESMLLDTVYAKARAV